MKNNSYAFHAIKLTIESIYICLARNFQLSLKELYVQ